jgi:signal transduction histidine kinase
MNVDDDVRDRLKTVEAKLRQLLQSDGNVSPLQKIALADVLDELATTSDEVSNALELLHVEQKELTEQLAIARQKSQFYQEMQRLNTELEKQIQQRTVELQKSLEFESMLKRITDKVRDSLDEDQILQTVVQEMTVVLGLWGCNSAIYNLEQGTSTICYEYANSIPAYQGRVAQMSHFPELYHQLKQGYSFQFCSLVPNPDRGQVAMLACPIFVDPTSSQGIDQAILGDLWLIHHRGYVFSEFEIRLVQQVANQCAIAIRQARLYQAAQVQVKELEKLNRLKDEFLSTVSHELRTPITNVKMSINMLRVWLDDKERCQRYLNILDAETNREADLIDDLLDLQRLEAAQSPIKLKEICLQEWVSDVVAPFRSRALRQGLELTVECEAELPLLTTDSFVLGRILAELLNNACKYTADGNAISLTIYLETNQDTSLSQMAFEVRNQADIPSEDLPHIFEKFYRVIQADRYKRGGTGLGLALVQRRVEQLGGTIKAESNNGWTSFTVRLPI